MNWTLVTGLVISGTVVALMLYDWIVFSIKGSDPTISRVTYWTSVRFRFFILLWGYALGLLSGHVLIPQHIPMP